ncbi:isopenicillin N synthase family oxygenase [Streptomyces sp. F001]|uniref:2OG-Fe(II) oxygenase family protein n=1 Tax=Streptomyces sp. F001 TaxID=1510026 RepID=UPI00101E2D8C|nr:2OG-Fe(II) oxygenase family protein [Streptomyces sp. F001]RZB13790.1 isopenicillin N synthase family oxygenase [Streptomyces sp. F001]
MTPLDGLRADTYCALPLSAAEVAIVDAAYAAWDSFFRGTGKYAIPGDLAGPSGYIPLCLPGGCEMKESFYLRPRMSPPPATAAATADLMGLLTEAAASMTAALGALLGRPVAHRPRHGCLRVMRYPPLTGEPASRLMRALADRGNLRTVSHTDLNALTILAPASAPGLEIATAGGWLPVDDTRRCLLVHTGQELEAATYGAFRATEHRVRNPLPDEADRPRLSCAYFVS